MKKRLAWKVFFRAAETVEWRDCKMHDTVNGRTLERMRHRLRPRGRQPDPEEIPF